VYVSVVGQDGMDVELDAVLANRPAKVSFALEPGCSGAVPAGEYLRDIRAFDADRDRRHDLPVVLELDLGGGSLFSQGPSHDQCVRDIHDFAVLRPLDSPSGSGVGWIRPPDINDLEPARDCLLSVIDCLQWLRDVRPLVDFAAAIAPDP